MQVGTLNVTYETSSVQVGTLNVNCGISTVQVATFIVTYGISHVIVETSNVNPNTHLHTKASTLLRPHNTTRNPKP